MGLLFVEVLPRDDGDPSSPASAVLKCRRCRLDAASVGAILSRDFQGRFGRAYLFDRVVNITLGPDEDRHLVTGLHTVNDIYCICCHEILGWRYEKAYEESEKYKGSSSWREP
uniref:Yippee domain-containing protein n=1 Tax=Arundo donax TaxID=35708 RepID=A0A0A9F280_ARUDO